jgi:hypothetical protein
MAAGGVKEFVAGEVLDEDEINDFLMQGVLVFAGTAARGSAITSPVEGQFAFLKDADQLTFYDGSGWVDFVSESPEFTFVAVAGGAGGGRGVNASNRFYAAGGGAGGYMCSVPGELTGGSATALPPLRFNKGDTFVVTVGAGGAGGASAGLPGAHGSDTVFGPLVAVGGGYGTGSSTDSASGGSGGSGGGTYATASVVGRGITNQGTNGGVGTTNNPNGSAGGGGAAAVGGDGLVAAGGAGGAGLASSITGSSVFRAGGGGGVSAGAGGNGGGGAGGTDPSPGGGNGTVNTGGGGGGAVWNQTSGNGGSGILILKYPSSLTLTIPGGLTSSTSTSGSFKITSFTAGTDTVTVG